MQRYIEQDLTALKEKLLIMASTAETGVIHAVKALVEHDDDLAHSIEQKDAIVDQLELEIDNMAVRLLSRAPMAENLRLIIVTSKIAQNLERVADEATTIGRRTLQLNQEPQLEFCSEIPRVADVAVDMLKVSLDAFVSRDSEKARTVIPRDVEVDCNHKQLQRELATFMADHPKAVERCLNLLTVSKSIERIADHAKNIAEEVVYLCDAEDIRHQRGPQ